MHSPNIAGRPADPTLDARGLAMTGQLTFDDARPPASRFSRGRKRHLREQFARFHADNPQVYETLVRLAREAKGRGLQHIGIGLLWEVMRWEMILATVGDPNGYRLNNNHRSRYARAIMENEPDLSGIFETRKLRSARPADLEATVA